MINEKNNLIERPPVVVVMGHVDHGKSTLLDFVRNANTVEKEAGGITQHTYTYEVIHKNQEGIEKRITFLDTPGHEAFSLMRERGANIADIAILVIAIDDGIKKQTIEALEIIQNRKIPYIIAVNKIDKPDTNIDKIKQDLAEKKVFVEGYGGDIPFIKISAKTGEGVQELLDMILLVAEMEELSGDKNKKAQGFVVESHRDQKRGISATLLIKDGVVAIGDFVASQGSFAPVRLLEDFSGKNIKEAIFSSPVQIIGFNEVPQVGTPFKIFDSKKEAEKYAENSTIDKNENIPNAQIDNRTLQEKSLIVPLVIKADTVGTLEAVGAEIEKIKTDGIILKILNRNVGNISESDVKRASGSKHSIVLGFNVSIEQAATDIANRLEIQLHTFTIIYELTQWLEKTLADRKPKTTVEEITGKAKILKIFSKTKTKQVVGGKVSEGIFRVGDMVKIERRDFKIGEGKIIELQQQKVKTREVTEGLEFGAMIDVKNDLALGDIVSAVTMVEKQ